MNKSELNALSTNISNDARALYCLGLRPSSNPITGLSQPLDYKALLNLLNSKEQTFTRGRQINSLLKELIAAKLVHLQEEDDIQRSLNGKSLLLTQRVEIEKIQNKDEKQALYKNWIPNDDTLDDIFALIGVIDKHYAQDELGDFIAYWLGQKQTKHTEYQWTQKFAQHIKRKRLANNTDVVKIIGTQEQTKAVSSIEVDDNARRLVAKYKKLKNNK
jgi:hypothetical protein